MTQNIKTLVSVLIPVYNAENFIQDTIESILSQTLLNFEILLLDDGSTDRSSEIIKSYKDIRVKYILCSHDFINTLNYGLDVAEGKYIALLDHDDLMVPRRLKIQYDYMEANPDIVACGGFMYSFGLYSKRMEAPLHHLDIAKEMIIRSPMLNPTGFIRKNTLITNNLKYSRGYSFAADFKFWSDIVKVGKVINIPEVLTKYRTYPEQTSRIYRAESYEGSNRIQLEIVEYFLSLVKRDDEYYPIVMNEFLPALDKLGEYAFFSSFTLFPLMYELIEGLLKNDMIIFASNNSLLKLDE